MCERQRIMALGVPHYVLRIDVGLSGFGEHYARLRRALDKAIQRGRSPEAGGRDQSKLNTGGMPLDWEILPEGPWEKAPAKSKPHRSTERSASQAERLLFLDSLGPTAWYSGTILGRRIYYVALFQGIAVADSSDYGNAQYYHSCSDESWKRIFRLTKASALRAGARRIFHSASWQARLRDLLRIHRRARLR